MATDDATGPGGLTDETMGIGVGIVAGTMFGMVGYTNLENLYAGAILGTLVGLGMTFMFPYVMPDEDERPPRLGAMPESGFHSGAAGIAITGGGFFFMAGMFTFTQVVPAVGLALGLVLLQYSVLSRLLPRGSLQNL